MTQNKTQLRISEEFKVTELNKVEGASLNYITLIDLYLILILTYQRQGALLIEYKTLQNLVIDLFQLTGNLLIIYQGLIKNDS